MLELFEQWLAGNLSTQARVFTALAPALVLSAYFIGGFILYIIRSLFHGSVADGEMETRGESILLNMYVRLFFAWLMRPLWKIVLWTSVPPMAITTLSVLLGLGAGIALAAGRFALGGWLYIFAGICDLMDGRLARATNRVTKAGGALDSILDRYADAAVLCGLAWYYRDTWILVPTLLALVGSGLVPYVRARGEALGIPVKVGIMQRAERILYLGAGCALSPILEAVLVPDDQRPIHRIAVMGIVLLAVATQITALQRLVYVFRTLSAPPGKPSPNAIEQPVFRNVVPALIATGLDFALVILLVDLGFARPSLATAVGCLFGGAINFTIHRLWSMNAEIARTPRLRRYVFVSLTSALLNLGGVAVMLLLPAIDYRIAWLVVRAAVFLTWNFQLQREYVFAQETTMMPKKP